MAGLILVNKPKGMTSHDVVNKIRKITGEKRVGHAGTLDPNATGLLIVGVGRQATKKLGDLTKSTTKTYEAELFLGATSTTDDMEGNLKQAEKVVAPSRKQVEEVLCEFVGDQKQTPPVYSAVKIKGAKAYELARKGKTVTLKPRKVTIYSLKLLDYKYPIVKLECEVSSGTYIRALARDIGEKLGTGAYLANLKRTRIGDFKLEDALELKNLKG